MYANEIGNLKKVFALSCDWYMRGFVKLDSWLATINLFLQFIIRNMVGNNQNPIVIFQNMLDAVLIITEIEEKSNNNKDIRLYVAEI